MPLAQLRADVDRAGLCQLSGAPLLQPLGIAPIQNQGGGVAVVSQAPPNAGCQQAIAAVIHLPAEPLRVRNIGQGLGTQ